MQVMVWGHCGVDKVTEDFVQSLKAMNMWLVQVGVESGNQRVLDGIQKRITLEQVIDSFKLFRKYGIKVLASMMLYQVWEEDGILCYESTQEVKNSLRFLKQLCSQNLIHYFSWQIATPLPGSRLYDIARKYNLLLHDKDFMDTRHPCLSIPGVSQREMQSMLKKGVLLKIFYALKSGNIEWKHGLRMWENVKAIFRL